MCMSAAGLPGGLLRACPRESERLFTIAGGLFAKTLACGSEVFYGGRVFGGVLDTLTGASRPGGIDGNVAAAARRW